MNESMKISELLNPLSVVANIKANDKESVLSELADALLAVAPELQRDTVLHVLNEREQLGSTGIGEGVAIPHGKLKGIPQLMLAFGRSLDGLDFESMDGQPVHLFFLLLAPEDSVGIHLKTLARISKLLKNSDIRRQLMEAADAEGIYQLICDRED